ncbi:MAG: hypothetical protein JJV97_01265 [SAR324 cluster bacterium]|nr:hypothetical protein [SAR324 cluster bacterium]
MSEISNTQSIINLNANRLENAASNAKGTDNLEKSDFMNLFMYQLANQNPLDPMDSSKMMASLAELGSMEQLQTLNQELKNMASSQRDLLQLNALSYLNQDVHVKNNHLQLSASGATDLNYQLLDNAYQAKANIINDKGEVVKQINLSLKDKGTHQLTWDGKNNLGNKALPGKYSVEIYAYNEKGKTVDVQLTKQEKVTQIKLDGAQPLLKVGNDFITIDDALMIGKAQ